MILVPTLSNKSKDASSGLLTLEMGSTNPMAPVENAASGRQSRQTVGTYRVEKQLPEPEPKQVCDKTVFDKH